MGISTGSWSIYLLVSVMTGRTYIGSTTNPARRLRQHNGEIVGGARSTRSNRPWRIDMRVSGFANRSEACRWERIAKCRARGRNARRLAFTQIAWGECPRGRSYPVPAGLQLHVDIQEE